LIKVACKKGKSCNIKFLQLAHRTTQILSISEAVKKVEKLALLITSDDVAKSSYSFFFIDN